MTFNGRQLAAIVKLAKAMAAADGIVKKEELTVIALELHRFGVKDANPILTGSDIMDANEAISIVSSMSNEEKKYVCSYLGTVMAIDKDIDDKERALWALLTALCDFPEMTIEQAITNMANMR